MKTRIAAVGLTLLGCVHCGGGLSNENTAAIKHAACLNLAAYETIDAGGNGSMPRAFERAAYYEMVGVLRRNRIEIEVDGGVECLTP